MILALKVLNEDATLNSFVTGTSAQFIKGSTAKLILQLFQQDKKIRYIPDTGAVITIAFKKSDNTTLTKTATYPFTPDDRSIIQVELTALETQTIISQNLVATVTEGSEVTYALLQNGLQMVSLTQGC